MTRWNEAKIRDDDTWDQVRRAWEAGETGAACARRFDVGLANLWRRRAAEGWARSRGPDPRPEPPEGWTRYVEDRHAAFLIRLEEVRALARSLAEAMTGGSMAATAEAGTPLWHAGWLLAQRAERLGPETAAADRAWAASRPWLAALWDEAGRLRPLEQLDRLTLEAQRDVWRQEHGVPAHAAPGFPEM